MKMQVIKMNFILDKEAHTLISKNDAAQYVFFSDLHGIIRSQKLIEQAQHDFNNAQLIGGGDYVDSHGKNNVKDVVDFVMSLAKNGAIILKGNHEQMMLDYMDDNDAQGLWFYNGGKSSLASLFGHKLHYDTSQLRQSKYYKFFKKAQIMVDTPDFLFMHAGVLPVKDYNDPNLYKDYFTKPGLTPYDFYRLWARGEYWFKKMKEPVFAHNETGKTIVTGHTPTALIQGVFEDGRSLPHISFDHCPVRIVQYENEPARIFADNGAHSGYAHHDGNVTVLNNKGQILAIYDYAHPTGIAWQEYAKENAQYLAH